MGGYNRYYLQEDWDAIFEFTIGLSSMREISFYLKDEAGQLICKEIEDLYQKWYDRSELLVEEALKSEV